MKRVLALLVGIFSYLSMAVPAFANEINICPQGTSIAPSGFTNLCNLKFESFGTLIGRLLTIILIIAIVVSLFYLIYGGIKWVISGGDKTAVEAARNHIVAAIVGLVIALLAYFILQIIGGLFGINITELKLPSLIP